MFNKILNIQNQNFKIENVVGCFDIAKLTVFLFRAICTKVRPEKKKKTVLNLVIHIQGFFGLKYGGIICVGNVNELWETHSQLPTECK